MTRACRLLACRVFHFPSRSISSILEARLPPVEPPHMPVDTPAATSAPAAAGPWYRDLTRYHWFVFLFAALGWLFDTMDQQLFVLARDEAMADLLKLNPL